MLSHIPVVILCGGEGTRLQSKTEKIPKPLLTIGDRPIVHHIMDIYSKFGFKKFVLCLGYKGKQIEDYFNSITTPWEIEFADTGEKTNTGGRINKIKQHIDTDFFMATYGDGLANIDIDSLLRCHQESGKIATITGVRPNSQFGIIDLDEDNIVVKFVEKPQLNDWVNGGFFVFQKEIFDYLDNDCVLEQSPFENLAQAREAKVYKHKGFWACMDTFKDFQRLNNLWGPDAPWTNMEDK